MVKTVVINGTVCSIKCSDRLKPLTNHNGMMTMMFPIRFKPSHYLYDLIRPYAWPTRGVPFDGLMGKGNQLLVTQTV